MKQVPEPWASALVKVGLTDPRFSDPQPSLGRLASAIGVHTTTVSNMVHGRKVTSPATVEAAAKALRVDVREVASWVSQSRSVRAPYKVPDEVNNLSQRQQDAISELIRAMAEGREEVVGNAEHPAPMNPTGESPVKRHLTAVESPAPTVDEPAVSEHTPTVSEYDDLHERADRGEFDDAHDIAALDSTDSDEDR